MQIILASQSPRRREALCKMGLNYTWIEPKTDETIPSGMPVQQGVQLLAKRKALQIAQTNPQAICIGADTLVVLSERVLGKPTDDHDAFCMLTMLQDASHDVYTGVCVCCKDSGKTLTDFRHSVVRFLPMSAQQIQTYIDTGEPMDKAGGYGIQGRAAAYIHGIVGSYDNVVGLPMSLLRQMLLEFDVEV